MTPDITAFDLSLTSTGVASKHGTARIVPKGKGIDRLREIRSGVTAAVLATKPELIVIEGYANGMGDNYAKGMGGGVARLAIADCGIPIVEVSPTTLKKFATGKGNANKDDMLEAAIRHFGFQGHGNDEADAWLLLKMAEAAYGDGGANAKQREAIASVTWPSLSAE